MPFIIEANEHSILKESKDARKNGKQLYIYGAGVAGESVFDSLYEAGILPDGFCVDQDYYKPGSSCCGLPIIPMDKLFGGGKSYAVIVACFHKKGQLNNYENIEFISKDFSTLYAPRRMDFTFISTHKRELQKLYEELGDEISRQHMMAFLNQRMSGEFELEKVQVGNQYFCRDLIRFEDISCLIDCGAYDGDSFHSFCRNYEQNTGKNYTGRAYLLEPTKAIFQKLSETYSDSENVVVLGCGAWSEKTTLCFSENEQEATSNKVVEAGEIKIPADKIDNIVSAQDKIGFIKMDIEGSELDALKGAEKVIKRDKPILAICLYHKKEDFITIPQYIKSLCQSYKLYLRAHDKWTMDLVLYALPY